MPTINLETEDFQDLGITPQTSDAPFNVILPVGFARIKLFAVYYTHDEQHEAHMIPCVSYLYADSIKVENQAVEFCSQIGTDYVDAHLAAKNKGLQDSDISESGLRYEHIEFFLTQVGEQHTGAHTTRVTKIEVSLKPNASSIPVETAFERFRRLNPNSQPNPPANPTGDVNPVTDQGTGIPVADGSVTPNPTEESNNE